MTEKVEQNKIKRFMTKKLIKQGTVRHSKCNHLVIVGKKDYYAYCPYCEEPLFERETNSCPEPTKKEIKEIMEKVAF